MFQNIYAKQNCDVVYTDSVEDFIIRHSVRDDLSTGSIRNLRNDIHSVMLESYTDNEEVKERDSKLNCRYATDTACKIVKYLNKLDQLAYKHNELNREKQNRDLRKFINYLRIKHLSDAISSSSFQKQLRPKSSEFIDTCDYELLWELYRELNDFVTEQKFKQPQESTSQFQSVYKISCEKINSNSQDIKKPLFKSKVICYPTSSSYKRITKLQREMGHTDLCSYLTSGAPVNIHEGTIFNYSQSHKKEVIRIPSPVKNCQKLPQKSKSKLHNTKLAPIIKQRLRCGTNELNKDDENNKQLVKENPNCLLDIESKIDSLVNSINLLIAEIQMKQTTVIDKKESTINTFIKSSNNDINSLKKEIMGNQNELFVSPNFLETTQPISLQATEEIVKLDEIELTGNIAKITNEKGTNTNNKAIFADSNSVGFMFKTFTSEKAVEANEPLVKPEDKAPVTKTEEKSTTAPKDNVNNTTKSANTEPLGILSLFRVSTATVRQLLSLVPRFDYYSYLPLLQSPSCSDDEESHFVCNICGAAFGKASVLNDHIKSHDLGFARNCCVCQHVLNCDNVRRQQLFRCQFCGEQFTRAYCRELHQQGCAKRLGVPPEVASGLILLR